MFQSAIEVTTYDRRGKAKTAVRPLMDRETVLRAAWSQMRLDGSARS
jgi:hypothetical protein